MKFFETSRIIIESNNQEERRELIQKIYHLLVAHDIAVHETDAETANVIAACGLIIFGREIIRTPFEVIDLGESVDWDITPDFEDDIENN